MGTPQFAVPTLDQLRTAGYTVAGVITATDKLGGRGGKKRIVSPVKQYALEHGLQILQPKNLKSPLFLEELRSLEADLQVVVAFRMLPELVWAMPPRGTINLHASLLPKYRGAAPINWAIINGETETGLTTFFIQKEIDTGNLLLQEKLSIGMNETAGDVHDRMKYTGANLMVRTVEGVLDGSITPAVQDHSQATKAPKIFHDMCKIDFSRESVEVHNFIRGLSPHPGAWTRLDGQQLKILKAQPVKEETGADPGSIIIRDRKQMLIATTEGAVEVLDLQLQGKKRMDIRNFLNGYSPQVLSVS